MSDLLYMILTMSLAGSLLAGILLLGEHLWGRRMRYTWQYYLWIIVLARLLIPGGLLTATPPAPAPVPGTAAAVTAAQLQPAEAAPGEESAAPDIPVQADLPEAAASPSAADWRQSVLEALTLVWVAGAMMTALHRITAYRSFVRCLRAGLEPVDDVSLLNLTASLAERLGIREPVEVCVNPLAASPMVIGWRQPCIVLPDLPAAHGEFECIVLHELVHWKRLDRVYKWAVQLAVCVHWFNPLVYVMSRRIGRLCELACDEKVLRLLGRDGAPTYGATLLNSIAGARSCPSAAGTLELSKDKRMLKERLERMEEHTERKPRGAWLAALLCACLTLCAACTRVYVPLPDIPDELPRIGSSAGETAASAAGQPALTIQADEAWIELQATDAGRVEAFFDPDLYDVDIAEQNGTTSVTCRGRHWNDSRTERVVLQVPVQGTKSVDVELASSLLTGECAAAVQSFRVDQGLMSLRVPESVQDCSIQAEESVVSLISESDFAYADVQMQLKETVLMASDALNRRLQRSGERASLTGEDVSLNVSITAGQGMVLLNLDADGMLPRILERLPALADAVGSGAEQVYSETEATVKPAPTAPAAPTAPPADGSVRGVLQSVGEGVRDILSEVGSGVRDILGEVRNEVQGELSGGRTEIREVPAGE